jgi:membrane protein DedA with SNARE-associated domain
MGKTLLNQVKGLASLNRAVAKATHFEKYGIKTVILARFVLIVDVLPIVVGARCLIRDFAFSILGGALWISYVVGRLFCRQYDRYFHISLQDHIEKRSSSSFSRCCRLSLPQASFGRKLAEEKGLTPWCGYS